MTRSRGHVLYVWIGIEECRGMAGEREEDFVEHGRGGDGAVGVPKGRFLAPTSRCMRTINRLNGSKRQHIECRDAFRAAHDLGSD
jgi:hypothetical protein